MKTIGILGGMGPESTAQFYMEIIKECQKQYGAQLDSDYPEIIIYNLPIPDIVTGVSNDKRTIEMMIEASRKLVNAGAEFIVMPCNTAHLFYPEISQAISVPFICIFLSTAKCIREEGFQKVALLATDTTIRYKSYADDFERNGIELLTPSSNDQNLVTGVILNILAGRKLQKDKAILQKMAKNLAQSGAQALVLACTDLPILVNQSDFAVPVFDTIEVLARVTVQYARGEIGDEILE